MNNHLASDTIDRQYKTLAEYDNFLRDFVQKQERLLHDSALKKSIIAHASLKARNESLGFSLFTLVSDYYYRENFHSDVLKAFLDPMAGHQEGNKYLYLFLDFLSSLSLPIDKADYKSPIVKREESRIDLLIKDDQSKKAIIIENKINNAGDQLLQLVRYAEAVIQKGYSIDAVVYLVLDPYKKPDMRGWSQDQVALVSDKLILIPAYDESGRDLLNGWLALCEKHTNTIDALCILRHYGNLIRHLAKQTMNKQIMEQFRLRMLEGDNYETALSLKGMIDDLRQYRLLRILDTFIDDPMPFDEVWRWKDVVAFGSKHSYAIDVIPEQESYTVEIFNRTYTNNPIGPNPAIALLKEIGCDHGFSDTGRRAQRIFKFPEEENALYEFITEVKNRLSTYFTRTAIGRSAVIS